MRTPGFEPGLRAWKTCFSPYEPEKNSYKLSPIAHHRFNHVSNAATRLEVNRGILDKYFALREINGISKSWLKKVQAYLLDYLDSVNWQIDERSTLQYFSQLKKKIGVGYYRKKVYQIRRFLQYLGCHWADNIQPPAEQYSNPIRVTDDMIKKTLSHFKNTEYEKQFTALTMLGADSGMRPEELFQLRQRDIDLKNRTVHINHNPSKGQTTKTGRSRVSFFTENTAERMEEYLDYFNNGCELKKLFSQRHCHRYFKDSPILVKYLRKYFSQKWDRRGGNSTAKSYMMGHSLNNRVDLKHYTVLNEEELKEIYDKIM